jgi:hypothetical protein
MRISAASLRRNILPLALALLGAGCRSFPAGPTDIMTASVTLDFLSTPTVTVKIKALAPLSVTEESWNLDIWGEDSSGTKVQDVLSLDGLGDLKDGDTWSLARRAFQEDSNNVKTWHARLTTSDGTYIGTAEGERMRSGTWTEIFLY